MTENIRTNIVVEAQVRQAAEQLALVGRSLATTAAAGKASQGTLAGLLSTISQVKTGYLAVAAAAGVAFATLRKGYQQVVGETMEYAMQVQRLQRTIGATAEDASRLIQAADDMGLSVGALQVAMRQAIRRGLDPTAEGLGKLADQYIAIQDPMARSRFLLQSFGRAGLEMGKLLEKGSAGIREMGENAEELGLVLSQDSVDAAEELRLALDQLNDVFTGLKTTVGTGVIPVFASFLQFVDRTINLLKNADSPLDFYAAMGKVALAEKAVRDEAARLARFLKDDVIPGLSDTEEAATDAATVMDDLKTALSRPIEGNTESFRKSITELKIEEQGILDRLLELNAQKWLTAAQKKELNDLLGNLRGVYDQVDNVTDAHNRQTKQILLNLFQQRLAMTDLPLAAQAEAIAKIAVKWGLMGEETADTLDDIGLAIDNFLESGNLDVLGSALDRVARDRTVSFVAEFETPGAPKTWSRPSGPRPDAGVNNGGIPKPSGDALEGGITHNQFGGPLGYATLVGEAGAEMIVDGYVYPASVTRQLLSDGFVPDSRRATGGMMTDGGAGGSSPVYYSSPTKATRKGTSSSKARNTRTTTSGRTAYSEATVTGITASDLAVVIAATSAVATEQMGLVSGQVSQAVKGAERVVNATIAGDTLQAAANLQGNREIVAAVGGLREDLARYTQQVKVGFRDAVSALSG